MTPATPELLKTTFPAFAAVADEPLQYWLDRAARVVTDAWTPDDQQHGQMLLAAHYLTLNGLGTGAEAEMAANGAAGFKSLKSGSLSLERGDAGKDMGEYAATAYGRMFYPLLRANTGGPRITATGCLPAGSLDPRIPSWPVC